MGVKGECLERGGNYQGGFLRDFFPGKDKGSVLDGDPACARVETRSGMT